MREPHPDWSPLGVNLKIFDEHPCLFHMGAPHPPPPGGLKGTTHASFVTLIISSSFQMLCWRAFVCLTDLLPHSLWLYLHQYNCFKDLMEPVEELHE